MIRPPGGASTIFDEADAAAAAANGERNVVTPERHVNYKMRSNFELGDEQPAPPPASAAQQQRRRSKPSGEIPVDFLSKMYGLTNIDEKDCVERTWNVTFPHDICALSHMFFIFSHLPQSLGCIIKG